MKSAHITLPSVSFVVPALNEELHIASAVASILSAVETTPISDYEIILVNDGSTDKTGDIMNEIAAKNVKIQVLHHAQNIGLGEAYKTALRHAACEYVMLVAGDDISPAVDIAKTISEVGKADIVLPYLNNPKLRYFGRRVGSRCFTLVVNFLFGLKVRYYQGMVPRRSLLTEDLITTASYAFFAECVVKLLKSGCSYVEVGIDNSPSRKSGSVALQPQRLLAVFGALGKLFLDVHLKKKRVTRTPSAN